MKIIKKAAPAEWVSCLLAGSFFELKHDPDSLSACLEFEQSLADKNQYVIGLESEEAEIKTYKGELRLCLTYRIEQR